MKDELIRRERMVRELEERGITDRAVLDAMRAIPRECFVDEALRARAYSDASLPIGEKQTISQPFIVARMCELLGTAGKGRVLEIGTGSGYHAAVLSRLFEQVYTVERLAPFSERARRAVRALGIENVHFKIFDGSYGWSEFAPYRGVIVTAATPEPPSPLIDQLEEGGCIVLPWAPASSASSPASPEDQVLVRIVKQDGKTTRTEHGPCRFVPLVGKFGLK